MLTTSNLVTARKLGLNTIRQSSAWFLGKMQRPLRFRTYFTGVSPGREIEAVRELEDLLGLSLTEEGPSKL